MSSGPARSTAPPDLPAGLPSGVIELAARHWRLADPMVEAAGLTPARLDQADLDHLLVAELRAPLDLEDWPAPVAPRPVAGGWVHDEVVDQDRQAFEGLLPTLADDGPEHVAAVAQELRWPVTPYRRPSRARPDRPPATDRAAALEPTSTMDLHIGPTSPNDLRTGRPPLVVDLSTHWAGPLATALLAKVGAEVIKIDPDCRPDGFRARPALYQHLNGAKETVDLDLRQDQDRTRFEQLLDRADLLVESFSRRVLPNLGYDTDRLRRRWPRLGLLSLKAFPADRPEADWLAYGPGVHAASGLGLVEGEARPTPIAYPDLIAGVAGYRAAVDMLASPASPAGHGTGAGRAMAEVSLFEAIAPLVAASMIERAEPPEGRHG